MLDMIDVLNTSESVNTDFPTGASEPQDELGDRNRQPMVGSCKRDNFV